MKKILIILLLLFIGSTTYGYDLPEKNQKIVDNINAKVLKIYDTNPTKAYDLVDKINDLLPKYIEKPIIYYSLIAILDFSEEYIIKYESTIINNQSGVKNDGKELVENKNETFIAQIDIDIKNKKDSLLILDNTDLKKLSSFDIEAKVDHLYLKNIYLKNVGTVSDINGVFGDVYLVNSENKIVSKGYVSNNYFYFDMSDYIVKRNTLEKFYVYSAINIPENNNQVGELILNFSTPLDALLNTSNGLRATSYSNGSFISSSTNILNPVKVLISNTRFVVSTLDDFVPSYSQSIGFVVKNIGEEQIELNTFVFQVNGGFLTNLGANTEFVLKRKGSDLIYGTGSKSDIVNGKLTIIYSGNDFNYISAYSSSEYVLEINHVGNPEGLREIILDNLSIGDGFGGTINNIKDYLEYSLPSSPVDYRYN
ncbi:MAG: hypothetical protein PHS49_05905 [Candidatus Gracilibacteria bacterium]|nr:hypothetical protein [Candidatus Gracilibacteria bacterium]